MSSTSVASTENWKREKISHLHWILMASLHCPNSLNKRVQQLSAQCLLVCCITSDLEVALSWWTGSMEQAKGSCHFLPGTSASAVLGSVPCRWGGCINSHKTFWDRCYYYIPGCTAETSWPGRLWWSPRSPKGRTSFSCASLCFATPVFPFSLWLCYPRQPPNPSSNPSATELSLITFQLSFFYELPKRFYCLVRAPSVPSRERLVFHTFLHLSWQWLSSHEAVAHKIRNM